MIELILGGQRSGKSRAAEMRAADWLARSPRHEALLIATALGSDGEMRERIARHRADRAARVPRLGTLEVPVDLARALREHAGTQRSATSGARVVGPSDPGPASSRQWTAGDAGPQAGSANPRLLVVDCLTLWLTNLMMPAEGAALSADALSLALRAVIDALQAATGPVVLVSNEIGLGVSPLSREARHFIDELGRLHQAVAAVADRVTLMVAGLPLTIKGAP